MKGWIIMEYSVSAIFGFFEKEKIVYYPYRTAVVCPAIHIAPPKKEFDFITKELLRMATKTYSRKEKKIVDFVQKPDWCDNHTCFCLNDKSLGIQITDGVIKVGELMVL